MPNVKVTLEYDGTDFRGFQKQPSVRTVQGELERALGKLLSRTDARVIGAGRTDAGVHATGQVINLEAGSFPVDRIVPAMNGLLPASIRARAAEEVPDDFHARYSAKARTYIYVVLNRSVPSALLARYAWHLVQPLDIEVMKRAASELIGTHDFSSFGVPEKAGGSTIRQLHELSICRRRDEIVLRVRANAFLRGMVRAMVGTLAEVGQGRREPLEVAAILRAGNRQAAGKSAPPEGLYLVRVEY